MSPACCGTCYVSSAMGYVIMDGIPVWGDPEPDAVKQILQCRKGAEGAALMADHHVGYSVPIGGVVAYKGRVSPSGVGYDIACGNKAVRLDIEYDEVTRNIKPIMDDISRSISFGVGRTNSAPVDHSLFESQTWSHEAVSSLKKTASEQLGTVGSGNHYVDLFSDEKKRIWCGVHFGSRGLGHRTASWFLAKAGGRDGMHVDPVVLDVGSDLGEGYWRCMELAGQYAYAGRDWVCEKVASILGASILEEVHNHHNFAWREAHGGDELIVVRKGATPAFPGQRGFIGGSMGDISVIVEGVQSSETDISYASTVHGAGRTLGRRQAIGKRGRPGLVTAKMLRDWIEPMGVELRGGGVDEAPQCYKRLPRVLEAHRRTIKILHTLHPLGVAMAGADVADPYRD